MDVWESEGEGMWEGVGEGMWVVGGCFGTQSASVPLLLFLFSFPSIYH